MSLANEITHALAIAGTIGGIVTPFLLLYYNLKDKKTQRKHENIFKKYWT